MGLTAAHVLCIVKLSLNISLSMIHTVMKNHKNLIQVLGHVVLSPASTGSFSLENFLAASLKVLCLSGHGTFHHSSTCPPAC